MNGNWLGFGGAAALALTVQAAEPAWPEVPPIQLREDVFGVQLRVIREDRGDAGAKKFLLQAMAKDPQPHVKAYMAWFCLYGAGWGAPEMVDPQKGRRLAEEAIAEGSIVARDVLGRAIAQGIGNMADPQRAVQLMREAAAGGATRSMARLAFYHAIGWTVPQDLAEADRLANRAAELGQPLGLLEIGTAYAEGRIGDRPDVNKALQYFCAGAGHSDEDACEKLRDLEKAWISGAARCRLVIWIRRVNDGAKVLPSTVRREMASLEAVAGNDPEALVELARLHLTKHYTTLDYRQARLWLSQAAEAGNLPARFYLAQMRLRGEGGPKEPEAALAEIRALATAGEPHASNYLGWLHYWGTDEAPGIAKDAKLAFAYCRAAAERGLLIGLENLGTCYEFGIGTPVNYPLAVKVYWQAYLRGSRSASDRVRRILPFAKP